jgi:hypothetical protein
MKESLPVVESAYERAMLSEVAALCRHIPHQDLCIQWDICNEMVIWDGQESGGAPRPDEPRENFLPRIGRLLADIPREVEVGIHLC